MAGQADAALRGDAVEVTIGGEKLSVRPLTDRDHMELDSWVRGKFLEAVVAGLPDSISEEERDRLYTLALRECLALSWNKKPGSKVMSTLLGLAKLLWQSAKGQRSEDELVAILKRPHAAKDLLTVFKMVNQVQAEPTGGGGEAERPTQGRTTTAP